MTLASNPQAGRIKKYHQTIEDYVVFSASDTTDPGNGFALDNTDGRIKAIAAIYVNSAAGGTSPTVNLELQGSMDGTTWVAVVDSGGTAIESGALAITGSESTSFDTNQEGIDSFPFNYLRVSHDLGGTTPTHNGNTHLTIERRA